MEPQSLHLSISVYKGTRSAPYQHIDHNSSLLTDSSLSASTKRLQDDIGLQVEQQRSLVLTLRTIQTLQKF